MATRTLRGSLPAPCARADGDAGGPRLEPVSGDPRPRSGAPGMARARPSPLAGPRGDAAGESAPRRPQDAAGARGPGAHPAPRVGRGGRRGTDGAAGEGAVCGGRDGARADPPAGGGGRGRGRDGTRADRPPRTAATRRGRTDGEPGRRDCGGACIAELAPYGAVAICRRVAPPVGGPIQVTSPLSVIVTGRGADRLLVETLTRVSAQTHQETEILVADAVGWPDRVRRFLDGPVGSRPVGYVAMPQGSPGAMRNAGVRVSRGRYIACVDRGELLEPQYGALATAALDADPRLGFAGASEADLFATTSFGGTPIPIDLATALRDPFALPGTITVRRDAWAAVGGFDEALAGLESYDLCLRLLAHAHRGLRR